MSPYHARRAEVLESAVFQGAGPYRDFRDNGDLRWHIVPLFSTGRPRVMRL
jgi:hypothetical protein